MRISRSTARLLGGIAILAVALPVLSYLVISCTRAPDNRVPVVPPSTARNSESPPKTDEVLTKLKPGMLRVDVEELLGPPSSVESVQANMGRLIYRATFPRDRMRPPLPPLLLEFDAATVGHPLVNARQL